MAKHVAARVAIMYKSERELDQKYSKAIKSNDFLDLFVDFKGQDNDAINCRSR